MTEQQKMKSLPYDKRVALDKSYKFYSFAIIVILLGALIMVLGIFWAVYPYDPIIFKQEPIPVAQRTIERGQTLQMNADFCKNITEKGTVERFLASDDLEIRLPEIQDESKKGCRKVTVDVRIPDDGSVVVPGRYWVKFRATYTGVTPISRTLVENFQTEPFDITK